jgi:ABC-2 type transport system permease protein
MKKTLQVLRHEVVSLVTRRSFLIITFGIPLLGILIFSAVTIIRNDSNDGADSSSSSEEFEFKTEGYVDQAGLIQTIPSDLPPGILIAYPDENSAREALFNEEISSYYIVPEDYVETGNLIYISPDNTPLSDGGQDWVMRWTLRVNMLGGDMQLASFVWNPMNLTETVPLPPGGAAANADIDCLTPGYACDSNVLIRLLPLFMVIFSYIFIMGGASMLLRNVSNEKGNRMMEILMLSVTPRQMLTGKMVGLGIVSLLPTTIYLLTGYIILRMGGTTLNLPPGITIPASLLIWGVVFFLFGYAIYASLMAGVGALVPNLKAATQVSGLVMMPLLAGYFLSVLPPVQNEPHGLLSTILSIFPLTAPVSMMLRLTVGGVPAWQLVLTIILLIAAVVFIMRGAAHTFHAQNLLSGQPFSLKLYLKTMFGRA